MKVLLANPVCRTDINGIDEHFYIRAGSRWPFSLVKRKTEKSLYMPFPFYLACTAALLEKEPNVEVFVEDSIALNDSESLFISKISSMAPDIMLFETATGCIRHDVDMAARIKKLIPGIKICLAGFHATALPKETMDLVPGVIDFILLREYEFNFGSLVRALRDRTDISHVPGIAYMGNNALVLQESTGVIDINLLPSPARHLFPSNKHPDNTLYWDAFCQYKPAVQMHGSRGCPFRCNFCVWNQVMYCNSVYRVRDVGLICDEIEEVIAKYGAREIYFDDDTFTGNKKHVLQFCDEMIRRGLNKRVYWSAMADFMITDEEMLVKMSDSGCIGLKFGVESGSPDVLKRICKPINRDKLLENCRIAGQLGIKTHATFSFGLSGETRDTMEETMQLAMSIDSDTVQFSIATPFPGTIFYEELKKEGRLMSQRWEDYDGNNQSVVRYIDMDQKDVVAFHQQAMKRWLKSKLVNPRWFFRQFRFIFRVMKGQGIAGVMEKIRVIWRYVLQS